MSRPADDPRHILDRLDTEMQWFVPDRPLGQAPDVLRFVVPLPPNVTNRTRGSTHWRRAYREKSEYWCTLDLIAGAGRVTAADGLELLIPPPPTEPWNRVTLRSTMHVGAGMDDDNALARHKQILDWLRRAKYITDDRKKNIVWLELPAQVVKRMVNKRQVTYHIELEMVRAEAVGR